MLGLLAVILGAAVGLSLGALGGGGSILTVPALVYALGQGAHAATTASLLIVGITALVGAAAHAREGRVLWREGVVFGLLGIAGSFAGSRLSAGVSQQVLLSAFAGLLLVAAAGMARRSRAGRAEAPAGSRPAGTGAGGVEPPAATGGVEPGAGTGGVATAVATAVQSSSPPHPRRLARALRVVAAASVVGVVTGFFGVGGGFVVVPALVLALGIDMRRAVGTSLLVIAINSASALAARAGTGLSVQWWLTGVFVAGAVAGSLVGNRIATRVHPARLTGAFTVLLVAVAVYTAARSLPTLL